MKILILLVCVSAAFAQTTVLDVLKQQRETTLLQFIDAAGLTDTLKGTGPFTIFAPSNRAFSRLNSNVSAALAADKTMLANVLKYHVVGDNLRQSDILMNERRVTTLSNQEVRLNHYLSTGRTTVNGVSVSRYDHTASNGVVHSLSGVLTPPAGTIVDVVKADPTLSTLLAAVQAAGLAGFLADQNPITVFAPTNDAFNALGNELVQKILADKDLLKTILTYHVMPGSLYSAGYHSAALHTFDEADRARLHKFFIFGYEIDSASVKTTDVPATNGVLHKIDAVLVPASVQDQVAALAPTTAAPTAAPSPAS